MIDDSENRVPRRGTGLRGGQLPFERIESLQLTLRFRMLLGEGANELEVLG